MKAVSGYDSYTGIIVKYAELVKEKVMNYIEKNFKTMKKVRPAFYNRLKKIYDNKEYSEAGIEEIDTRDGNKALSIEKNGKKFRLNSLFRPLQEAEKWADQYNYQNLRIPVFMFGIGNGIFVRELLKRLGNDAVVFLMEPDVSIFIFQLLHQDFSDILLDDRVLLFVKSVNDELFEGTLDTHFHWSMVSSQIVCRHPGYDKIYIEECLKFQKDIKYADEIVMVNRDTISDMSKNIVNNALKNLHFIRESNYAGELTDILPEDVPVIVVSAGPSLDKNICELKKAVGKAFIIATDTAVKYLLKYNVPFDVMLTLDARKNVNHICRPECVDLPMLCILEARNEIMEFHKGRKIWFRGGIYIENLYKKFNRHFVDYSTGGCVATAAYAVGVAMGAKRIILIGQDLAYQGNVTHAGGVKTRVKYEQYSTEMIEGIDGEKVRSRGDWIIYRDWFERAAALKDAPEVIDATEGGALIKGTKIMKLSEAIDAYCIAEFDFQSILDGLPYTYNEEEYQKLKQECNKLSSEFVKIRSKAKEALKAADDLKKMVRSGENSPKKENKKVSALRKFNNFIEKQSANEFLETYCSSETTREVQKINIMTDDEDENMLNTLKISSVVYESYIKGIDKLTPILEKSLQKM